MTKIVYNSFVIHQKRKQKIYAFVGLLDTFCSKKILKFTLYGHWPTVYEADAYLQYLCLNKTSIILNVAKTVVANSYDSREALFLNTQRATLILCI